MSRTFETLGGIAFLAIGIGLMVTIMDEGLKWPGTFFAIPVLGLIYVMSIRQSRRADAGADAGNADLEARVVRIEQRLTDMQDILIAIDDRLQRSETPT